MAPRPLGSLTRTIVAGMALGALAGCGGGSAPEPPAAPARPTATAATTSSTTIPAAHTPPPTTAGLASPEDARRYLQERGVDPERLSEDLAEQMRHRFDPGPPR